MIKSPTHFTQHSETKIDYIATSYSYNAHRSANLYPGLLHHTGQMTTLPHNYPTIKHKNENLRKHIFSKENRISFQSELNRLDSDKVLNVSLAPVVDKSFDRFLSAL